MSALERVSRGVLWAWRLCKGWLPQVLGLAATFFGIVWGAYGSDIWTRGVWALVVAVLLALASLAAQFALQRPSYMELAKQRDQALSDSEGKSDALDQAFQVLIRKLAEHCSMDKNSDRASVYYFHQERFVMLARWSIHPTHTRPGRGEYSTGQGAIGDAWDRGSVVMTLPSTRARWEQRLVSHHGFTADEARKLQMQCQSIAALRIEADHTAVGVVVFESIDKDRATQKTIDEALDSMPLQALSELVSAVATLTPRVEEIVKRETAQIGPTKWKLVHPESTETV